MKLSSFIALSGLIATGAVQAQSVTLYGRVDAGIESVSHVASVGQLNRMPSNPGIFPSRLGLRAIYTLEMGFAPDTGASGQGGRLLGRQSHRPASIFLTN